MEQQFEMAAGPRNQIKKPRNPKRSRGFCLRRAAEPEALAGIPGCTAGAVPDDGSLSKHRSNVGHDIGPFILTDIHQAEKA